LRIGVACHNYQPHSGGIETVVHNLVQGFAREHEVHVVTTAWQGTSGRANEAGVHVYRMPAFHASERISVPYPVLLGPGMLPAARALRRCDVIHAHGCLYNTTLLGLAARRRDAPFIVTEHVGFVPYRSRGLTFVQQLAWAFIGHPVSRRAHRLVTINSRVQRWLGAKLSPQRLAFIPNGVSTTDFRPATAEERRLSRSRLGLPADDTLALFVGRQAQRKNLEEVLRFVGPYRLVVCGADRQVPEGIYNLGILPHAQMRDVFAAADFLIHAATGEGFPVAVQEAFASGLAVALLWDPGYTGAVDPSAVSAAESLPGLEQAAAELAANPERRREIGARALDYARRSWSWPTTVSRYLDLFDTARHELGQE
jgi:glycosyltransferase involved in cell wall biosynthesis